MTDYKAIAFVDTETTGLDYRTHDVWELAAVRRDGDGAADRPGHIMPRLDEAQLANADPVALRIGRYEERIAGVDEFRLWGREAAARWIAEFLSGCVLVGANPAFDDRFLTKLLQEHGYEPTWHYRTVCVEALAAGYLLGRNPEARRRLPWRSDDVLASANQSDKTYDRHTAMGDVEWVMDAWDAFTGGRLHTGDQS